MKPRRFAILGLLPLLLAFGCGKRPVVDQGAGPLIDYASMRDEVIKRVKSGSITPDSVGIVQLPQELGAATADGQAIVANDASAGLLVLFKTMAPRPNEAVGLLYAERSIPAGAGHVAVGPLKINVKRKISEHWFEISYRVG